jgi:hypothetical protein
LRNQRSGVSRETTRGPASNRPGQTPQKQSSRVSGPCVRQNRATETPQPHQEPEQTARRYPSVGVIRAVGDRVLSPRGRGCLPPTLWRVSPTSGHGVSRETRGAPGDETVSTTTSLGCHAPPGFDTPGSVAFALFVLQSAHSSGIVRVVVGEHGELPGSHGRWPYTCVSRETRPH